MSQQTLYWSTPIEVIPVIDPDSPSAFELINEILTTDPSHSRVSTSKDFCDKDQTPQLWQFRNEFILPQVEQFCQRYWDYEIGDEFKWKSWFVTKEQGDMLPWHHHSSAHVSTVFYLRGYHNRLVFTDPRSFACRGFPSKILETHFSEVILDVNPGELVIFPSYLPHYAQVQDKVKTCIATDFKFKL